MQRVENKVTDEQKERIHIPVLLDEVIEYLSPKPNQNFIDATLGAGGHAHELIARVASRGKVLGIERDVAIIPRVKKEKRLIIEQGNYIHMEQLAQKHKLHPIHGILFDVGMSSFQIESSGRGFSFLREEPLDMRTENASEVTAALIVNSYPKESLEHIFGAYGEERFAGKIAQAIYKERKNKKIVTTFDLVKVIAGAVPQGYRKRKIHFATRVFQALRIAVNNELDNLRTGLEAACRIVTRHGRVGIISFHSLEHRIIKQVFNMLSDRAEGRVVTSPVVLPSRKEIIINPRARSAQLRVWERL